MAGGLKCNPFSVSLVSIGTLLAIISMFVFVIVNVPLDFTTCEERDKEDDTGLAWYSIVIQVTDPPVLKPEVFSWSYDLNRTLAKVRRVPYSCRQNLRSRLVEPGKFIEACMEAISSIVPDDRHDRALVYLTTKDQTKGIAYLDVLRESLTRSPFNTSQTNLQEPDLVTEGDIAVYRWVAENEELGTIRSATSDTDLRPDVLKPTTGIVDIKPTSASLTFALTDGDYTTDATTLQDEHANLILRLYDKEHKLHSRSFPCYGLELTSRRFQEQLVFEVSDSTGETISNPCAPIGYSETLNFSNVSSLCSMNVAPNRTHPSTSPGYGDEASPDPTADSGDYTLSGTGNSTDCQRRLNTLIQIESNLPVPQGDFMAFVPDLPAADFTAMDIKSGTHCNWTTKTIDEFKTDLNATGINPCFLMTYMNALIFEAFKMEPATWDRADIKQNLETSSDSDHSWVPGFMTSTASSLPPPPGPCILTEEQKSAIDSKQTKVTVLIVMILCGCCIVGLGYGMACRRGDDNWVPSPLAMYQFE